MEKKKITPGEEGLFTDLPLRSKSKSQNDVKQTRQTQLKREGKKERDSNSGCLKTTIFPLDLLGSCLCAQQTTSPFPNCLFSHFKPSVSHSVKHHNLSLQVGSHSNEKKSHT